MLKKLPEQMANDLILWLIKDARLIGDADRFDQAIIDKLREVGLPLARVTTGVPSLHPQVDSFSALWEEGKGLTLRQYKFEDMPANAILNSPILTVYEQGEIIRRNLETPAVQGEYSILPDLRRDGFTDYIVVPLPFSDRTTKAITFATKRRGGFTDDEISVLVGVRHALAAAMEVRYLRYMATMLMDTYVGPIAGQRVLKGEIKRGSGEVIRSAIWFCDLKGFTESSATLSSQALIDLLNDYFEIAAAAIGANEGEVLKFIGDAVLAIFPLGEGGETAAVENALRAARSAVSSFAAGNLLRREQRIAEINCGISLHFGDVFYGNVGGQTRLDFTVIGPAVNLASRVEGLTRSLERDILVTKEFAERHPETFEEMGLFALKGIKQEQMIYAPVSVRA